MGIVHRLPDDLANQIAAGEVVERPSSVAKELIENAIDAHATRIRIDVEAGGIALIRVSDDGDGMSRRRRQLATERHATSKISTLDDLSRIRLVRLPRRGAPQHRIGEPLRAANATPRRATRGWKCSSREEPRPRCSPAGSPRGPPSRCAISSSTCRRAASSCARSPPSRRTSPKSPRPQRSRAPELTLGARARGSGGARVAARRNARAARARGIRRRGALCRVAASAGRSVSRRSSRVPSERVPRLRRSTLLVNGRAIRDRALLRAVAQAYGSVLEPGRYPLGVVYLEIDPALVDVNVHPQKAEVRFADGRAVGEALFRILADELSRAFGMPVAVRSWSRPTRDEPKASPPTSLGPPAGETVGASAVELLACRRGTCHRRRAQSPAPLGTPAGVEARPYPLLDNRTDEKPAFSRLSFVAQVKQTFLLCEGPDGLYVLDQHAAAERVTFDRLRKAYAGRDVATQALLFPVSVEVTASDAAFVDEEHAAFVSARARCARDRTDHRRGPRLAAPSGARQTRERGARSHRRSDAHRADAAFRMRSTSSWRRWRATVRCAPAIASRRQRQARFSWLSIKSISRGTARTGAPSSRGSGGTSWSAKLDGDDIDLADAEIAVVVGPTASGKSDLALGFGRSTRRRDHLL